MPLATRIQHYLTGKHAQYDVLQHEPTFSSARTAQATHVTGKALAKAVVLHDGEHYLLAVLPASRHIRFNTLERMLGRTLRMVSEAEATRLFGDCETGAVPPLGEAYGLPVVMDESLTTQPEIYLEGGDHTCLLHMSEAQFEALMSTARRGRFAL